MLNDSKSILIIMLIAISTKLIGFIREIAMASVFGTTSYTDAYLIATTIPLVIFASLGESLSTTLIPMYSHITEKRNKHEALRFMNNILNIIIIVSTVLSILGIVFTKPLVSIFAIGFKGYTLELAAEFTRIMLPGIILIGINYILTAFLQANKSFYATAFVSFPKNIVIIISTFLSYYWGKSILIYGTLLAIASQMLYQLFFAFRKGFSYKISSKLVDKDAKRLGYLVIPVFLGMTVQQLNVLIDKTLASTLGEGSIAALNFANRLELFAFGVFTAPLVMVVYTRMSQLAAKDDWGAFDYTVQESIYYMLLLLIPVSVGAMCLSTPIVKLLFERGSFDARATLLTSTALFYYSLGMIGTGLRMILAKAFYSLQDTKTPMVNGFYAIIANIILNLVLIKPLGHGGLALATSISATFGTALLLNSLNTKRSCIQWHKLLAFSIKAGISALFMAIGVTASYNVLSQALGSGFLREAACILLCMLLGAFIYFFTMLLMKVEEVSIISLYLKKVVRRVLNKAPYMDINTMRKKSILIGISSLTEDEAAISVYQLICHLSGEKYDIALVAAEGSTIIDKVRAINSRINIMVAPVQRKEALLINYLKSFSVLLKELRRTKFDIVHFHSYELASAGCIAAWLLRVPRIIFTIHEWHIDEKSKRLFIQKLISRLSTHVVCTSRRDLHMGLNNGWIYPYNAYLIYHSTEKDTDRTKISRRQLGINPKDFVASIIADYTEFEKTACIIKVLSNLAERNNKFRALLTVASPHIYESKTYMSELGLSSNVLGLYDISDSPNTVNISDIFLYFSDKAKVPNIVLQAMHAAKPVITNDNECIHEFIHDGINGFIIDEHDIDAVVMTIEKLIKRSHLREVLGMNGKSIVNRKYRTQKMVRAYESLYSVYKD